MLSIVYLATNSLGQPVGGLGYILDRQVPSYFVKFGWYAVSFDYTFSIFKEHNLYKKYF